MATMRKANRLLTVREEDVPHYLSRGYDQVSDQGDIVCPGKFSTTDKVAAARVAELEAENEALKAEVAELEAAAAKPKYVCEACGKEFTSEKKLADHVAKEHPAE